MRVLSPRVLAAIASLALASCGRGGKPAKAAPSPLPAKTAAPAPAPSRPAPSPKASRPSTPPQGSTPAPPASTPSASSRATPPPAPVPAPVQTVARLAPDAPPEILDVQMSETDVQPGDSVSGSVVTSSNVASVEARIGGYAVTLRKIGVGHFALTYKVGDLPWFLRGNFTMKVIARNTRGDAVTRDVALRVR